MRPTAIITTAVLDRGNTEPTPLPKPPVRELATAALALALLAMSWAIAPIDEDGGPHECTYCAEPPWPMP
jgi:hypothetical protein